MAKQLINLNKIQPQFREGMIALIDTFGRACNVVCPGISVQCPNCFFNSQTQKSGKYNNTGPQPFTSGPCPVCKGLGKIEEKTVHRKVYSIQRAVKTNVLVGPQQTKPGTIVRIKGKIEDMQPLLNMEYILLDVDSNPGFEERYVEFISPELKGNILPGEFFIMFLQRV